MGIFPLSDCNIECYLLRIRNQSKTIYWILIGTVILLLACLPLIKVNISVNARGYLQSNIEKQQITSPVQGRIIYTGIKIGEEVSKGDTLLILDSDNFFAQIEDINTKINIAQNYYYDLELLNKTEFDPSTSQLPLRSAQYKAEFSEVLKEFSMQYQKYIDARTNYNRNKKLFDQNLIAKAEFDKYNLNLTLESENLKKIILQRKSIWQRRLAEEKNNIELLNIRKKDVEKEISIRVVTAPVDGEIILSKDIQVNSQVFSGQTIAEITPKGEIIAVCFIKPSDIGHIYLNQPVLIQIDAFNFNEWGLLKGKIASISNDVVIREASEAFYVIRCIPDVTYLSIDNSKKAYLMKGMSLTARIIICKRSLSQILIDRLNRWGNPNMTQAE